MHLLEMTLDWENSNVAAPHHLQVPIQDDPLSGLMQSELVVGVAGGGPGGTHCGALYEYV